MRITTPFLILASMPNMTLATLRGNAAQNNSNNNGNDGNNGVGNRRLTACTTNSDCGTDKYCAAGQCLTMGACETEWDCRNPNNMYPVIECTGPLVCNENKQCGRECGPTCSDGTNGLPCLVTPCTYAENFCKMEFTQCSNDFCGGCSALVFNDAGNHEMCTLPRKFVEDQSCTSSADCGESKYCSQGVCTEAGKCSSDADCFNPDNIYATILCVGPISCDVESGGQCGRTCSDSNCPADKPEVECLASTCDTLADTCQDDIASCVDYSCGDCGAFAFDEAGFQVCNEPALKSCNSTEDCGESEYCSQAVCTEAGKCSSDADCFNPDNVYATVLCVGPISCDLENGQCGRTCSDSNCPTDKPEVQCLASTCDTLADICQDNISSCVDYSCGDCGAFAFDEAGFQVCNEPALKSCNSTEDCGESEYCSQGVCTEAGKCSSDADCFNQDNVYATVLCVGPISCDLENGQCGRTCSDSNCPADKPEVQCLASTCDTLAETCQDNISSCVDYSCGECGAFAFDEAGYQVCQSCSSAADCAEDEYCAGGKCLADGKCGTDVDCFNPTNMYPVVLCVGALSCQDNGMCGVECGVSNCPNGAEPANCLVEPCRFPPSCQESWEYCINDYCNGCGVKLLDAGGNEVTCTPV